MNIESKKEKLLDQIADKIGDKLIENGLFRNFEGDNFRPTNNSKYYYVPYSSCDFNRKYHFPKSFSYDSLEEIPKEISEKCFGTITLTLEDLAGNEVDVVCWCHFYQLIRFEVFNAALGDYDGYFDDEGNDNEDEDEDDY